MNVFDRIAQITKASWNEMMEQNEDPIQAVNRYLHQQQRNLDELETLYREQIKHQAFVRKQFLDADEMVRKREEQAELAVKAGEDEIARMALQDRLVHEEKRKQYGELFEQTKGPVKELEERIQELSAEIREVKDKRQYYEARMQSLQLQKKMKQHQSSFSSGQHWFNRLEDSLQELEAEVSAWFDFQPSKGSEYRGFEPQRPRSNDIPRESFGATQKSPDLAKLDEEIAKLKAKLEEERSSER